MPIDCDLPDLRNRKDEITQHKLSRTSRARRMLSDQMKKKEKVPSEVLHEDIIGTGPAEETRNDAISRRNNRVRGKDNA